MGELPERDWRVFLAVRERAMERFFDAAAAGLGRVAGAAGVAGRERFWGVAALVEKEKEAARDMFDGVARSLGFLQLVMMCRRGLIREEELREMGDGTRDKLREVLRLGEGA